MKRWMYTPVVLVSLLALTACGGEESAGGGSGDVTLRMLVWGNGPAELKGERDILDVFEEKNPGIKVELSHVPWDNFNERLTTMSAGRNQPDVFWMIDAAAMTSYASQGMLMELDGFIEESGIKEDEYLPGAWDIGAWEGVQYALPRDLTSHHIVFNKDMFDEAGHPYPEAGWTWDDFLEAAKATTIEEDGKIVQFGIAGLIWEEMIVQNGGASFNIDGSKVEIDSPETIEAIEFMHDLVDVHRVAPLATESEGLGDLFLANRAAMAFAGPWHWRQYEEDGEFEWDIVEVPAGKAGNKSQLLGLPIGIGSQTDHPEEAWKLLEFLTHGEGQSIQANIVGANPSVTRETHTFAEGQWVPENVEAFQTIMEENTVVQSMFPDKPAAASNIQPVIDQIMDENRDVDVADALGELADSLRAEFDMD
ncbi:ABC transporter substrate-binding protein [Shouchella clausii]|nr:sugar ABC transporter substrate-binding protein [Shouchella clausii]